MLYDDHLHHVCPRSESLELEGWEPQDFDRMVRRLASDDEYYEMVTLGGREEMSY